MLYCGALASAASAASVAWVVLVAVAIVALSMDSKSGPPGMGALLGRQRPIGIGRDGWYRKVTTWPFGTIVHLTVGAAVEDCCVVMVVWLIWVVAVRIALLSVGHSYVAPREGFFRGWSSEGGWRGTTRVYALFFSRAREASTCVLTIDFYFSDFGPVRKGAPNTLA